MNLCYQRTTVFCKDIEHSLHIYRDILGFKVVEDKTISGAAAGALLGLPDCTLRMLFLADEPEAAPIIGLFQISDATINTIALAQGSISYGQTALVVATDSFDTVENALIDADVRFLRSPISYEKNNKSKFSPAGLYREMIFYDPDGVLISVMQILPLPNREEESSV